MVDLRLRRPARSATVRTQARFARRQWVRRWLTWRYLLGAVLLVGLVAFSIYAVYFSPWLRLEEAEVTGESQVTEEHVLRVAAIPEGDPLVRVDLESIEKRVRGIEEVKDVEVSRQWPHGVLIEVTERVPIAVFARAGGFTQIDDEGETFGLIDEVPPGLPIVETDRTAGNDQNEYAEAAAVITSLPESITTIIDHIEVSSVDDIRLVLDGDREVLWGSADNSEDKAAVLTDLLQEKARVYDVSVPGMPTIRR